MFTKISALDQNRFKKRLKDQFTLIPFDVGDDIYPPVMFDIREGSEHCNLTCPKCPGEGERPIERLITEDNYREVYDNFLNYVVTDPSGQDHYVRDIHFSHNYSDPLLSPILPALLKYLKVEYQNKKAQVEKLFREITIITNGLLLRDPEIAKMIAEYADILTVSINATNPDEYLQHHGRNFYENVLTGIQQVYSFSLDLQQQGLRLNPLQIEVSHVLFANSLSDLSGHLFRLASIGVHKIMFRQDFYEKYDDRLRNDKKIIAQHKELIERKTENSPQILIHSKEKEEKYANINNICAAFNRRVAMDERANLFHCMHLKNPFGFGNLFQDSLQNIWENLFHDRGVKVFYWPCEVGKNLSCPSGNSFINKLSEITLTEHVDYDRDYFKSYETQTPLYLATKAKKDLFDYKSKNAQDLYELHQLELKNYPVKNYDILAQGYVLESKERPGDYLIYVLEAVDGSVFLFNPKGQLLGGACTDADCLEQLGFRSENFKEFIFTSLGRDSLDIPIQILYEDREQLIRLIKNEQGITLVGEMGNVLAEKVDNVLIKMRAGKIEAIARQG